MKWIEITHPLLLRIYSLKHNRKGTKNYLVPRKGISKKLYVEPEVIDLQEYLIITNPFLHKRKRLQNKERIKGKEVVGVMAGKKVTLPKSMTRLNAQQKHFIFLLYSDYYDKELGCYTRDNPINAWLVVYGNEKIFENLGEFEYNEKGERIKYNLSAKGKFIAGKNARGIMTNPNIKLAIDELIAELFGDKEEIRTQLMNKLLMIVENPKERGSTKINAIKEFAKIAGVGEEKKVVEHRVINATEQRKIVGQLSGKDNPFAEVGSKEYSMKELLVDEKPEGNIQ